MATHLRNAAVLAREGLADGRGRAFFLILTLAITVAAWLGLAAMAAPFVDSGSAGGSGISIRNGSQRSSTLPLSYAQRIQATPGAHDVAWMTLQVVVCKPDVLVALSAWGGPGAAAEVSTPKEPVDPAIMRRWEADPLGILVADKDAAACGWHAGQAVEPPDGHKKPLALHIIGIVHRTDGNTIAHYDYINRTGPLFGGKDQVIQYSAHAGNAHQDEQLAERIEAEFAHDFPTVSATTNATVENAWARFGKVQQLLAFVMAAILLCAASVLISVLAHAVAQRRAKFALLQVLGFRRGTLFGAFALELLIVALIGALLGCGLGLLVERFMPTGSLLTANGLKAPAWAWWGMPVWVFVLIATALAWPALVVARVRPRDYKAL